MRENEFEKKVQQKMDEFKLRPSEAVWEKVEEGLRKKKKRRVVFFIFLLAALSLLGYSGYFLFNNSNRNLVEQNTTLPQNESIKPSHSPTQPAIGKENSRQSPANEQLPGEKVNANTGQEVKKTISKDNKDIAAKVPFAKKVLISKARVKNNELSKQENINTSTRNKRSTQKKNLVAAQGTGNDTSAKPRDVQKDIAQKESREEKDITQADVNKKDDWQNKLPVISNEDSTSKTDIAALKITGNEKTEQVAVVKNKTGSKINWGFDISVGISDSRKIVFPFSDGQKSMDAAYGNPNTGSLGYIPPLAPSSVKPGIAFKLGPVGEMKISERSRISLGIQYALMSSKMQIGSYRDTSVVVNNAVSQAFRVDAIYRGIYREDFTNLYHFILLPFQYQLQINKGTKLPILWSVGASPGYLLATNALTYDTIAGGIYYRDKDAFNKFQFNLHTGFALRLGNDKKMQWTIGPEISMSMNKLMKDTYSSKQYLFYGGLTGRLIFAKKK